MISPSSLFLIAVAAAQIAVPPLKARVTDLTGTLTSQQRSALEQTLAEFESRKGAQVAVLIVPSTQPDTVDQFAVRVQESWKLGRKGIDDGVLLVVAKNDRKLRIEVGYGLEGVLPDAIAKRIIEDDITPRFKQGDFYGGIRAGTDHIMRVIEGEKLPPPRAHAPAGATHFSMESLFWLFAFVVIGGGILRAVFGRALGAGIVGGVAGVVGWALLGSLVIGLIAALIGFLLTLFNDGRSSGWSSGDSFGGGFSSSGGLSSSGSGGFSGGGGSSGGGGASGSW